MASISIMVTDNENGVINNSFNFSEQDIKRVYKALGYIYQPKLELPPLPNPLGEYIPQPYNPNPRDIFAELSRSLIQHVVQSCIEEEANQAAIKHQNESKPIEVREN